MPLAFNQQAANELGGNLLCLAGRAKNYWGRDWESVVAMGVAL